MQQAFSFYKSADKFRISYVAISDFMAWDALPRSAYVFFYREKVKSSL